MVGASTVNEGAPLCPKVALPGQGIGVKGGMKGGVLYTQIYGVLITQSFCERREQRRCETHRNSRHPAPTEESRRGRRCYVE